VVPAGIPMPPKVGRSNNLRRSGEEHHLRPLFFSLFAFRPLEASPDETTVGSSALDLRMSCMPIPLSGCGTSAGHEDKRRDHDQ
jgi:hypothetical protein